MDQLIVAGIPLLTLVFGLVEFAKKSGLSGKWLTIASMAVGVVLGIGVKVSEMYPAFNIWFSVVVYGLAMGLAASGIYSFLNARMPDGK